MRDSLSVKTQPQLPGFCSWRKGEGSRAQRSGAQAGAAAAEMLQDRQEGGGRLQKVFRTHCFRKNNQLLKGSSSNTTTHGWGLYSAKDLIHAFQDKTICRGDGDLAAKDPECAPTGTYTHTHTLTHSKPGHGHYCLADNFKHS